MRNICEAAVQASLRRHGHRFLRGARRRLRQAVDHEANLATVEADVGQQMCVEALEFADRQATLAPGAEAPERLQARAEQGLGRCA